MAARHLQHDARARVDPRSGWLTGRTAAVLLAVTAVVLTLLALYGPDGSLSLVDGPVPTLIVEAAIAGVLIGVFRRPGRWWLTWGVGIAVGAAVVVALADWRLRSDGVIDQHFPPTFILWVWGAMVAFGVGATGWWSGPPAVRVLRWVTVPLAAFAAFVAINTHYGYWPTMGALLGRPEVGQVSGQGLDAVIDGRGTDSGVGTFGPTTIPAPPGFDPGRVYIWLPPAFDQVRRADLSVLVMIPGYPGKASNWERAGEVVPLANAWAAAHGGIAPVMVFVSGNSAQDRDTECVNGTQGPAQTFLTDDVVDFITHRLGIHHDPARWGAVGFSEGGTCALGLATEDSSTFGRVVDLSGELTPTFGRDARTTLVGLYAGDATAMLHHEPSWLFAHRHYRRSVGWFGAGAQDPRHERIARTLADEATAAGMRSYDVSGQPGDHSWTYAKGTFALLYPSLVHSMPSVTDTHRGSSHRRGRHEQSRRRTDRHPLIADPRRGGHHHATT